MQDSLQVWQNSSFLCLSRHHHIVQAFVSQSYYNHFHMDGFITVTHHVNFFWYHIMSAYEQYCEMEFTAVMLNGCFWYFLLWGLKKLCRMSYPRLCLILSIHLQKIFELLMIISVTDPKGSPSREILINTIYVFMQRYKKNSWTQYCYITQDYR